MKVLLLCSIEQACIFLTARQHNIQGVAGKNCTKFAIDN